MDLVLLISTVIKQNGWKSPNTFFKQIPFICRKNSRDRIVRRNKLNAVFYGFHSLNHRVGVISLRWDILNW